MLWGLEQPHRGLIVISVGDGCVGMKPPNPLYLILQQPIVILGELVQPSDAASFGVVIVKLLSLELRQIHWNTSDG